MNAVFSLLEQAVNSLFSNAGRDVRFQSVIYEYWIQ